MPRALSLKKVQQTSKNQKSIASFFKKIDEKSLKPTQNSACKETAKRKATSPKPVSDGELIDKKNDAALWNNSTPKKKKTCNGASPKKINHKSPNKENNSKTPSSTSSQDLKAFSDEILKDKDSPIDMLSFIDQQEFDYNDFETKTEAARRPLTPVTVRSENHDTIDNGILFRNNEGTNKNHVENKQCLHHTRKSVTPKKSPIKGFTCSPVSKLKTPEKSLQKLLSPSKCGSTVKALDFGEGDFGDMFGDEWDMGDIKENEIEELDLSTLQRCEILSVKNHGIRVELKLKNASNNIGSCFVEGIWVDTPLFPGDIISVTATRDASGQYCIGNSSGLLVLRPDHLVSSTSVVAGVFCKRKAVLQERWKGIDSANTAMTIGILIHELVQKALTQNITSLGRLRVETDTIIKESVQMLYDAGLSEEEASSNMQAYLGPLAEFMQNYVEKNSANDRKIHKDNWSGRVDKVLDIEENLCCPQLGLKGKIDATLEVTIHSGRGKEKAVVPLELKSGKASVSAEHRGQLVLYNMMLSVHKDESAAHSIQRGLLLYLKDKVELREVSCGYPERRDLVMLRNQLAQYLAPGPDLVDPEQLVDIEDASILLQQRLPEPVHHHNACAKCPYLTICSLHLWHTDGPTVSETHPLSKLRGEALGHLTSSHIEYFLKWTALLKIEEKGQMVTAPLHALWTDSAEKRTKRGTCASNLTLNTVKPLQDRYLHVFQRNSADINKVSDKAAGPLEGEFSIVSLTRRPWIAAGVVSQASQHELHIVLERDLTRRLTKETLFHIDTYESYATTVQNLTNLGVLMEDSERAERLRRLIIDKSPPEFEKKLPREVGRLGVKLMRALNIEQQRAVLRAVTARDYVLLRGLPGTGKTQTISVLIQMLVGLKQRVLVTAHTHSAVDTVLSRLPESLKVMRLGSSGRVAPSLLTRSEQTVTAACDTVDQLGRLYDSMEVVGVTCLGAAHAMLSKTVFDVCIVDEATQVLQSTVLRPLFAAKRFVLVGDPDQLPPVVRSRAARRLGMEESLFHRLMREDATSTLQLQYRMNQPLVEIANKVAYNNRLKCADDKIAQATLNFDDKKLHLISQYEWMQTACSTDPKNAAVFIDVPTNTTGGGGDSKSCTNEDEASVVIALVESLKKGGIESSDIGVIAPYRSQVSLLRRVLSPHGVEASTVDQFQGRDKSVVIYSCTRRDDGLDDRNVKEGEVLNDQRRLAVSVTRAKHKLIIVGNSRALLRYSPLKQLIDACTTVQIELNELCDVRKRYKM